MLFLLVCGCPAAPSEVELTIALGVDQVEVQATLRDVRLWTQDPAEALRTFEKIRAPEAPLASRMLQQLRQDPRMPRLQSWEWKVRGEALDLVLTGTMPRSEFEACVTQPSRQRPAPEEVSSHCQRYLWRSGNEYISVLDEEKSRSGEPEWIALGATRWPIHEQRLQTRVRLTANWFPKSPALPAFELQSREPDAVASYVTLVERLSRAFIEGDTPECKALQKEAVRVLPPEILSLFQEKVRRERLWLIEALARHHGLAPVRTLPKPLEREPWGASVGPEHAPALLPRQRPPADLLLKLVRLYDQAAMEFAGSGETGDRDFTSVLDEPGLQALCGELSQKAASWRRPCKHLLNTRP